METESANRLNMMRSQALEIFRASLGRVDPYEAVKRFVRLEGKRLLLQQEGEPEDVLDLQAYDRFVFHGLNNLSPRRREEREEICLCTANDQIARTMHAFLEQEITEGTE